MHLQGFSLEKKKKNTGGAEGLYQFPRNAEKRMLGERRRGDVQEKNGLVHRERRFDLGLNYKCDCWNDIYC